VRFPAQTHPDPETAKQLSKASADSLAQLGLTSQGSTLEKHKPVPVFTSATLGHEHFKDDAWTVRTPGLYEGTLGYYHCPSENPPRQHSCRYGDSLEHVCTAWERPFEAAKDEIAGTDFEANYMQMPEEAVKKDSLRWQIVVITMVSVVAAMAAGQLMTWIHHRFPLKAFYDVQKAQEDKSAMLLSDDQPSTQQPPPYSEEDAAAKQLDTDAHSKDTMENKDLKKGGGMKLLRTVETEWIVHGFVPYWFLPALVVFLVIGIVFILPEINDDVTPYTKKMSTWLAIYLLVDLLALRWLLGAMNWALLRWKGFSQDEIDRLAGPCPVIPTGEWLKRGGQWLYQCDSYSRKIPHVLHWAGLAQFTVLAADSPWARFQFSVMGATADIILLWAFSRTTAFIPNMLVWLASIRTNDGFARRMNLVYCKCSSVMGMGVTVPVSSWLLSEVFGGEHHSAFMFIVTLPCAYGDCLAEIVGVNGRLRFDVSGLGERNNKSVEGMVAMFLGSVLPCLPYADAVGGWPYLLIVGVLATIAETWTPRGFDNVSIPLASAVGVLVAVYLSRWAKGSEGVPPVDWYDEEADSQAAASLATNVSANASALFLALF